MHDYTKVRCPTPTRRSPSQKTSRANQTSQTVLYREGMAHCTQRMSSAPVKQICWSHFAPASSSMPSSFSVLCLSRCQQYSAGKVDMQRNKWLRFSLGVRGTYGSAMQQGCTFGSFAMKFSSALPRNLMEHSERLLRWWKIRSLRLGCQHTCKWDKAEA